MKHIAALFLYLLLPGILLAQEYHPINMFFPEKNYAQDQLNRAKYADAVEMLRAVVRDFELDHAHIVAILLNGKYESRMRCDGQFDVDITPKRLNDKIVLAAIDRLEARFNTDYVDPWKSKGYVGTINLVIPAMDNPDMDPNKALAPLPDPEPWNDPIVQRLAVAAGEKPPKIPHQASTAIRAGIFVGVLTRRLSVTVGLPLDIPITKHLSICGVAAWNWKKDKLSTILVQQPVPYELSDIYTLLTFEPSVTAKYYLNSDYPHYYITGGPYIERGRAKWVYNTRPELGTVRETHTTFGFNIGAGVMFYSNMNVSLGWSFILSNKTNLPPYQDYRGATITVGWMFGKK
ncbi:MAG: hypothetical protein WCR52_01670 [Bacteroidota bacterium]